MSLFLIALATVHGRRSHVLVDACGSLHPSSALVCGTECVVSFSFLLYVRGWRGNTALCSMEGSGEEAVQVCFWKPSQEKRQPHLQMS